MYLTTNQPDFNILFDKGKNEGIKMEQEGTSSLLIKGGAGIGKTTLALQLCNFAKDKKGANVYCLYYTFEQVGRQMVKAINDFGWDASCRVFKWEDSKEAWRGEGISKINIVDSYKTVQQPHSLLIDKIEEHVNLLNDIIDGHRKIVIVLDSVGANEKLMKGERKNVGELLYKIRKLNAFIILVKEEVEDETPSQTEYLTDVIIKLKEGLFHSGTYDYSHLPLRPCMLITKTRGSVSYRGPHEFIIGSNGFRVYPSLRSVEKVSRKEKRKPALTGRANFGIERLDRSLNSEGPTDGPTDDIGMLYGTSLLLKADPGSCKTELGVKFLIEGFKKGERGLFISCRIDKKALKGLKIFESAKMHNDFLKDSLSFINAIDPFMTPAQTMSLIRSEVETMEHGGEIRRAVIFGISVLDTLAAFRPQSLEFLQVLIKYFENKKISGIFIDWPPKSQEPMRLETPPTELAGNFIAGQIDINRDKDKPPRQNMKMTLVRKEHRLINQPIGSLSLGKVTQNNEGYPYQEIDIDSPEGED